MESSEDFYPNPDGKKSRHKPRRNYWGNLYEQDTLKDEDVIRKNDYYYYESDNDNDYYYYYHDDDYE